MANCPDIYINPTYWTTPHPAEYGNLSIDVGSSGTTFAADGLTRNLQVTVQNNGTEDSPTSLLQLWWADPSTSFALMGQIDVDKTVTVPGGDGLGTDGSVTENFAFTPTSAEVGTNGGHVCLLAQVANTTSPTDTACSAQGHAAPAAAATDARSAIRNIHVYDPSAPKPSKHHARGEMHFAFAAANNRADVEDTKLAVRVLDPAKERERLQTLVSDPAVYRALALRGLKFAVPDGLFVAEGRERVVLPRPVNVLKAGDSRRFLPRIGHLGPLSNTLLSRLQVPDVKRLEPKRPIEMKLAPGEMRQTIVTVKPCKREDVAYVVAVDHHAADGRPLGGLLLVFVKPHEFF